MDETLAQPPPPALRELAKAGAIAVFLDFDGTLVEIAPSPDCISVPPDLGERLAVLARRLDGRLAMISGRAIEDLETHCGPLSIACAGSHGAVVRTAGGGVARSADGLPTPVLAEVTEWSRKNGVDLEVKPHGVALHSRARPHLEESCAAFLEGVAERNDLSVKRGKRVAELVSAGVSKAGAVRQFMAAVPFIGATPIFIGDDITDEDGFAACAELGGFGIAVGDRVSAGARFALPDPAAVIKWAEL